MTLIVIIIFFWKLFLRFNKINAEYFGKFITNVPSLLSLFAGPVLSITFSQIAVLEKKTKNCDITLQLKKCFFFENGLFVTVFIIPHPLILDSKNFHIKYSEMLETSM